MERKTPITKFLNRIRVENYLISMDCKMESPIGFWGTEAEEMLMHKFPLHKACRDGDPVTLSRLAADATPDVLTAEDQFYSWTPIHWASYFGKVNLFLIV